MNRHMHGCNGWPRFALTGRLQQKGRGSKATVIATLACTDTYMGQQEVLKKSTDVVV